MCGICGIFGHPEERALGKMVRTLTHRGPDAEGRMVEDEVALGVRRLRVIDLETGDQPIANEDGSVVVVFNGQIYNFMDLREKLEAHGHRFRSRTDTEVLVHLYEDHGTELLAHLEGMFAFAIWDKRKRRLFLARDRLGEKPLYYYRSGGSGGVYFSSELKSLLASGAVERRVCLRAVDFYLSFRSVPAPLTMIEGVRALEPAEAMVVDAGGVRKFRYWSPVHFLTPVERTRPDLLAELRSLLEQSVRRRCHSDVPLGAFLSGGIDSSLVVALMTKQLHRRVVTLTVGFEDSQVGSCCDERKKARRVARHLDTEHHEEVVSGAKVRAAMPRILWAMDQPTGDSIPHYLLYEMARRHCTVALSGTGGDELFAGYPWFRLIERMTLWDGWLRLLTPPGRALLGRLLGFSGKAQTLLQAYGSFAGKYTYTGTLFKAAEKQRLLSCDTKARLSVDEAPRRCIEELAAEVEGVPPIAKTTYMQLRTDLPSVLLRDTDATAMSHSLEVRVPLLDHHLVEFACSVPGRFKLDSRRAKALLRDSVRDLLPPGVLEETKQGFIAPMEEWVRTDLKPLVDAALDPAVVARRNLFDPAAVTALYERFKRDPRERYFKVWNLAVIELWLQLMVDGDAESLVDPGPAGNSTTSHRP